MLAPRAGRRALAEGRLAFVEGDVTKPDTLLAAVEGVDAVVQAAQFTGAPVEDPARGLTYDERRSRRHRQSARGRRSVSRPPRRHRPLSGRLPTPSLHERHHRLGADSARALEPRQVEGRRSHPRSGLDWTIVRVVLGLRPSETRPSTGFSATRTSCPSYRSSEADGRRSRPCSWTTSARSSRCCIAAPEKARDTIFAWADLTTVTLYEFLRLALQSQGRRRPVLGIPKPLGRIQAALPAASPRPAADSRRRRLRQSRRRRLRRRPPPPGRALPRLQPTPLREALRQLPCRS